MSQYRGNCNYLHQSLFPFLLPSHHSFTPSPHFHPFSNFYLHSSLYSLFLTTIHILYSPLTSFSSPSSPLPHSIKFNFLPADAEAEQIWGTWCYTGGGGLFTCKGKCCHLYLTPSLPFSPLSPSLPPSISSPLPSSLCCSLTCSLYSHPSIHSFEGFRTRMVLV